MLKYSTVLLISAVIPLGAVCAPRTAADANFGPSNPFYAPSTLPFHAPPFDKIKDEDYQRRASCLWAIDEKGGLA